MRYCTGLVIGAAILSMTAGASASPTVSNELMLPLAGKVTTFIPSEESGGNVPSVTRGQALGIACADIDRGDDVRVVMQVTRSPGEAPTGYGAILATSQRLSHGAVHIRVPDLPDLSHHTVKVKVFVMGSQGQHVCDAGRVKIV
jgi:hypothetical protein